MSKRDRRHVLAALLGMLAGLALVGGLLVLAQWEGAAVDGLAGPGLALLVALVILRFAPGRSAARGDDSA